MDLPKEKAQELLESKSRRNFLKAAGGLGAVVGIASGQLDSEGQGNLYGGNMALEQAYRVSDKQWIGPESARSNVEAKSGRVYKAVDTEVEYYGDSGNWTGPMSVGSSSQPVPSVSTEELLTEAHVSAGDDLDAKLTEYGSNTEYVIHGTHSISPISHTVDNVRLRGVEGATIEPDGSHSNPLIQLIGDGIEVTGFRFEGWLSDCLAIGDDSGTIRDNIVIEDNEFVGGSPSPGETAVLINDELRGSRIDDNYFEDVGDDCWSISVNNGARSVYGVNIENNWVFANTDASRGIQFKGRFNQGAIRENRFRGVTFWAVRLSGGAFDAVISGNNGSISGGGIVVKGGRDCTISDNTIEDGTGVGLLVSRGSGSYGDNGGAKHTIRGNVFTNFGEDGIRLKAVTLSTVSENSCNQNSQASGGTYSGIRLIDDSNANGCVSNTLVGNVCTDTQSTATQEYGIKETGAADYNRIADNQVPKNATGGVNAVGTNTTTGGNTATSSL